MDEIEIINKIEEFEIMIDGSRSHDKERFIMLLIKRLRAALDEIHDREYMLQLSRRRA